MNLECLGLGHPIAGWAQRCIERNPVPCLPPPSQSQAPPLLPVSPSPTRAQADRSGSTFPPPHHWPLLPDIPKPLGFTAESSLSYTARPCLKNKTKQARCGGTEAAREKRHQLSLWPPREVLDGLHLSQSLLCALWLSLWHDFLRGSICPSPHP